MEIGDGIYVWTNASTQSKLSVLSRLFKLYDEDPAGLVFYLRDESELNADEPGSRHELRRRYWTYALPTIKEAHGEGGSFSNASPTRDNWINGYFGISGCSICCVANYDGARAGVVFQKPEREDNKKAFDALIVHKSEIESALGITLNWNRAEDKKASKVYAQLSDVGIESEVDWLQMARFHADWSKRFYDMIVPFIIGAQGLHILGEHGQPLRSPCDCDRHGSQSRQLTRPLTPMSSHLLICWRKAISGAYLSRAPGIRGLTGNNSGPPPHDGRLSFRKPA